jgi:hypothetical protein
VGSNRWSRRHRRRRNFDDHRRRKNIHAILYSGRERDEKAEMAALAPALRELFPGQTVTQALDAIVAIDADLRKDPVAAAQRLYQMFGGAEQQQHVAQVNQLTTLVEQAQQRVPSLNDDRLQEKTAEILLRPDFARTHDPMQDLARAHQIAVALDKQNAAIGDWAQARLASMDPQLAEAVVHTIYNDKQFGQVRDRNVASRPFGDPTVPQTNFEIAVAMTEQKMAAVSKARKVRPVRSSSGAHGGSSSGGGIDAAISAAMSKHGM